MSLSEAPRTPKWPYLLADVVLVAAATAIAWKAAPVWTWREISLVGGLTALGAWILIQPFQRDHEAAVKLFEQVNLASATEKLGRWKKPRNRSPRRRASGRRSRRSRAGP